MIQKNCFKISRLHEKCLIIHQHKFDVEMHEINFSENIFFCQLYEFMIRRRFKLERGDLIYETF